MALQDNLNWVIPKNPATVIALSFLTTILLGSFLLCLPIATASGNISFIDALFTATSATCVTGLIVVDTASYFTIFGQLVILLLIQTGGLGIMTFSSFFTILLGKRMSLRNKMVVQDALDYYDADSIGKLLTAIILSTLVIELIGAIPLFIKWYPEMGLIEGAYYALFHSVSAFCNAGFSLFCDSLIKYREDFTVNLTVSALIIMGGIGFVVLVDVRRYVRAKLYRRHFRGLSLQSKVAIYNSIGLILLGALAVFLLEMTATLKPLSWGGKVLASFFTSVTSRTAGFNTLPTGNMTTASLMVLGILMFIGASPGSTGGGIKTTTLAIFIASMESMIFDLDRVTMFKRTIARKEIQRSTIIIGLASLLVLTGTLCLIIIEGAISKKLTPYLFEVISAFGTVGLSTGLTGQLDGWGKLLITCIMYAGRLGPLTLALAITSKKTPPLRYPTGKIMVG